ncbi:YdgA family protein [Undibacterium sp. TS12]|uniref:YdgA family protein n=1 Tax=Undibacterium sp. TS12 TaxID=2908202 RepID=UPI001F4C6434|nr:YdgA family protein [Undibacterium sp. TS12]
MSKSTKLIALVVVLAVSYPAASWFTGKRVETNLVGPKDQDISSPYVKVLKQDYQRGVFSSVQDVLLEFNPAGALVAATPELPGAGESASSAAETPATESAVADAATNPGAAEAVTGKVQKTIQLRIINRIKHGPLPGFSGFGAALIQTELVLDAESQEKLNKLFGNAKPLEILTRLGYAGGGHIAISSPALNTDLGKDNDKVSWQGFKMDMDFEKDYKTLKLNASAPGLTIDGKEGQSLKMGAVALKGDLTRAYPGTHLFLGKTEMAVTSLSFADPVEAKKSFSADQIKFAVDTDLKDELLAVMARIGISKLKFDKDELSDIHYDYGVRRIHGPSLVKVMDAYKKMGGDPEKISLVKAAWEEVGPAMLQKEPEIALERLSVVTSEGEAKLAGSAKLVGANAADMANPMMMLPKVQAVLDVTLTEGLVAKLGGGSQKDPEMQKIALENMNRQIATFVEQGYINRNDKLLSSKLEWRQGKLTVNGKAFSR